MIPSLSEIQATAKKATRGAGLSWGIAEEAARATAFLWRLGYDSPSALAGLLTAYKDGTATPANCPLHQGAKLCDSPADAVTLHNIHHPLLMLYFVQELTAEAAGSVLLTFDTCQFEAHADGICEGFFAPVTRADVTIEAHPKTAGFVPRLPHPRCAVDPTAWATLAAFEHKTYAPATEASRLAGAGAGLSDND